MLERQRTACLPLPTPSHRPSATMNLKGQKSRCGLTTHQYLNRDGWWIHGPTQGLRKWRMRYWYVCAHTYRKNCGHLNKVGVSILVVLLHNISVTIGKNWTKCTKAFCVIFLQLCVNLQCTTFKKQPPLLPPKWTSQALSYSNHLGPLCAFLAFRRILIPVKTRAWQS